jgi:hypothetical protein
MCVVCALSSCATPAPHCARLHVDRAAALIGIFLRGQPLHRHLDEIGIAARRGAIGKRDLQHFGQQMDGLGRAKAQAAMS